MIQVNQPLTQIIRDRISRRTYEPRPLPAEIQSELRQLLAQSAPTPFNQAPRFALLETQPLDRQTGVRLGTYGFIRGAQTFIAGIIRDQAGSYFDLGYRLETIILWLTGHGLATCWLGGTFNKSDFIQALTLQPAEIIPAVTPVGYPAPEFTTRERLIRWGAGSRHRLDWSKLFFRPDWHHPLTPDSAAEFGVALEMVRLAPSASNRQPWRVLIDEAGVHFFLQRTPGYIKKMQLIDLGIAMCHFELTCREQGLSGHWLSLRPLFDLSDGREYVMTYRCATR